MTASTFTNLSGKILIASPYMLQGDVFHKSLIYVLSHTPEGSIGLIVNHPVNRMPMKSLFKALDKDMEVGGDLSLPIYLGGPIELEKAFLLHSGEYDKNLLFKFQDNLAVSSNAEILKDLAKGSGPASSMFIVGYTVWKQGELETELEDNFWLVTDCDKDLIFSEMNDQKWNTALKKLGIEDSQFASQIGHC